MRSGETDCAETVSNSVLKDLGKSISEKLRHIANLDMDVFMVDKTPYILEMNARFGGGYPFSHIAGVNLPKAIVNWLQNKDVDKSILTEKIGVFAHKDIEIVNMNKI
ncbi:carbamoyl phosphate synthase-like protein [Clostridium magnum DSM 2767]|uniref:Carbamoyl phosphate synthase-like protein n=2 Tax=Clostridium magnum TaxID=33954 RepID=A0A161YRR9_9CLOT|nr:carbamoyl phosphate synthase-like protein [Clostridium magnum DSM 2767]SHI92333.1 carbamoyl-phosphate synthase large subunit [Clostridium magnum DSM 2767]